MNLITINTTTINLDEYPGSIEKLEELGKQLDKSAGWAASELIRRWLVQYSYDETIDLLRIYLADVPKN